MKRIIVSFYCIIGKDYMRAVLVYKMQFVRRGAIRKQYRCNDLETILVDFQIQKYKTAPQLLFNF